MGQLAMEIQGIELKIVRTFLDTVDNGSDLSRKTRSTGDRPRYAGLASELGHVKLPPRGADYGPFRKKIQLVQANVALEVLSGPVQDNGLASSRALSAASDESVATTISVSSREFYSAVMCNRAVIDEIAKELDEEIASIQQGWKALPVISPNGLKAHFDKGTTFFKRLITLLFERSPPSARDVSALSALETPEVMDSAIKRVSIFLGKQVLDSLGFLVQLLNIPDGSYNHNQQRFQDSLERGFAKAATKHFLHEVYADRLRSVVSLESLRNSMLRAIEDVFYQQLRKAASLLTTRAKFDRQAHFVQNEKANFNARKKSEAERFEVLRWNEKAERFEVETQRILAEKTEREEKAAAEREDPAYERWDWEEQKKQYAATYVRSGPWGAPDRKLYLQQKRSNLRYPKDAAQLKAQPALPPRPQKPSPATLGMWLDAA